MEPVSKHLPKSLGEKVNKPSMNNESLNIDRVKKDSEKVEAKAQWLVEKFQSPGSYKFYCKVAYALEFGTIDRLVGTVTERKDIRVPGAYFNKLAKKEMGE